MRTAHHPSILWPGSKATALLVAVWTILVLVSLLTQREQLNRTASALARIDAIASLKKDMTIRQWASSVGGIFIREEHALELNSLDEEERVSATRGNGEKLRLVTITPMHLLLAIQLASNSESKQQQSGVRERLTSKQLRNIDNAPDDWEGKALEALNRGDEMVTESLPKNGGHGLMRVMIPMRMEKECLACHRDTLVPVGGLRGGAAMSINLNAYRAAQEPSWQAIKYWHLGVWFFGLAGIFSFGIFSRHRNIERQRSDEERRENEAAFSAMAEGAIITDAGGTILWVNDSFCRISGYARDEVIRQNPRLLKSGTHDVAFYRQLWQQLVDSGHWRGEIWNRRKTGEVFPEELSIQALKGPDGKIRRFISVFSDITERKRNEKELQDYREHLEDLVRLRTEELTVARDEAEAANRSKSAFLANMSHELRTPLNAVIGFSRLMDKDPELAPKQRRNAEIINNSGIHLLTLINDILELSKIESGKIELRAEEVALEELLEQVVDMMRLRAEQADAALILEMSELPVSVVLDPVMLRQVLLNLLSNAVKFTPSGTVALIVRSTEVEAGLVRLDFSVADTGIGIPGEDLTRIFQPFEQAGGSHQGGTGLGLTISQQYVSRMGGGLVVDSELGKGSVFSFFITVPAGQSPPPRMLQRPVARIEPQDHGCRVIVADPFPEGPLLIRSLLEPLGFTVSETASCVQLEAMVAAGQADLVLIDWFMPDGNGLDTVARIRARTDFKQPRLIMLTANALLESRQAALDAGADDFLSKPCEEASLYAALEKHLAIHFCCGSTTRTRRPDLPARRVCADDLARLTPATRDGLVQAALSLNHEQIERALLAVARENPGLAIGLREFSNTRQYQALWHLLGILDPEESS
jgi:PAS domain S-box-containing protein